MSNKYIDHLQVLVEDDANRQLVNGLGLNLSLRVRQLQVLQIAGGWQHVLEKLADRATIQGLETYSKRHLLLLIDFDDQFQPRWTQYVQYKTAISSQGVADRVYLLGCLHEPEKLKAARNYSKSIEKLGLELSDDCAPPPAQNLWQHADLHHNAPELARLVKQVKPFLYD